jgi:hypothetical protein
MRSSTARLAALISSAAALATTGCGVPDAPTAQAHSADSATATWHQVGHLPTAISIGACAEGDGRLYTLNSDHTIWVNRAHGNDNAWTLVTKSGEAREVFCANNRLHAFNNDKTLFRNDGDDKNVKWTYVGQPDAVHLTGATAIALLVPYGVIYALHADRSLWKSTTGEDRSWTEVGHYSDAIRIAAGGSELEAKPFALYGDGSLWLNSGDGCDGYWHRLTDKTNAQEITAASAFLLYALNHDKTLSIVKIAGSDGLTSVRSDGQPQHCDGHGLVLNVCGGDGQGCCANDACSDGLACNAASSCEVCGDTGQLACAGGVCHASDNVPGDGGRCEHCGNMHERVCAGNRCNEVHTAPDDSGRCEFDHWCGGDGQPCCDADFFGGNCNGSLHCVFEAGGINRCQVENDNGGGGGGGLCTNGQAPRDFCAAVTCSPGYYNVESMTACTQDAADVGIAGRHTNCDVQPSACP